MFSAPSLSFRSFWSRRRRHAPDHQAIAFAFTLVAFKSRALAVIVTVLALMPNGLGTGSGRSVAGVDLGGLVRGAVEQGLLVKGGGHAMAAGLTIEPAKFAEFLRTPQESSFAALPLFLKDRAVAQAVNLAPRHSGRFGDRFLTVPSGVLSNQSYFNEATN